jgi:hypothetical protein
MLKLSRYHVDGCGVSDDDDDDDDINLISRCHVDFLIFSINLIFYNDMANDKWFPFMCVKWGQRGLD